MRPSRTSSSGVSCSRPLLGGLRHHFIKNRQALFSSRHVVPPGSVFTTPSAFRQKSLELVFARGPPQDIGGFDRNHGTRCPALAPSSFRRPRSRASGCSSSCSRSVGAVSAAGMAAGSADTARERAAGIALLARPRRLLGLRLPPQPLLAAARAARGRRRLRDPARHPGQPAAAGRRAVLPQPLRRPGARVRPLRHVDGRALRRALRPRRDADERRRLPRHGHVPRAGPRPVAVRSRCAPRRSSSAA